MPFLKPADGLIVRDPDTRAPLTAEGEEKTLTSYWLRRLTDGDVTEVVLPKPKKDKEV